MPLIRLPCARVVLVLKLLLLGYNWLLSSESSLTISSSDMGQGAAATVRKAKWGRTQVALKLFKGEAEHVYKELTAEAAILHVSRLLRCTTRASLLRADAFRMRAAPPPSLASTPFCVASLPPAPGSANLTQSPAAPRPA